MAWRESWKEHTKNQTNYVTKVRPTANLQESECKRPTTEIMKITLLKRGTIRRDIVILCTNLFFCSKQSWMRRPQLTKNGRAEELPITARIKSQKSKQGVIEQAQKKSKTVHCATPMDLCHLKNYRLDKKFQTYKGRVVQRGDTVKDDSGSCAVFTEQGSSASHRTAAKVLCVISRLPRTRRTSK